MAHEHEECKHMELKFCAHCDLTYCLKCLREWGASRQSHWYAWLPTVTSPHTNPHPIAEGTTWEGSK